MSKKDILMQLRAAKTAHIQWRAYAQALVSGLPVQANNAPLLHTECKFGQWYYGDGQRLASLTSYSGIETPHEILHQIYMKLFTLLFGVDDRSMFQKLFGSRAKLKKAKQEEADMLMQNLLASSRTLLEAIALLEHEVTSMSEEEIDALY